MALSPKHFSFLFFLALLSPLFSDARDSQFFSKITTTNNNNNARETVVQVPNYNEQTLSNQEQEPSFIPDTQNGYGLYGHETRLNPSTAATKTTTSEPTTTAAASTPYKTQSEEPYTNTNSNHYYNKEAYVTDHPQGMSDTRFMDSGYTTNNNNNNYYYNKEAYVTRPQGMSDTRYMDNGYTNPTTTTFDKEAYVTNPQGLSHTSFSENGKNYYNPIPKSQENNNYYPNRYFNSREGFYNGKGYHGNNENSYEAYELNNSLEGYQNQEVFQEREEEFVP